LEVHHHPGKANVVADALSQKDQCYCLQARSRVNTFCEDFRKLNLSMVEHGSLATLVISSNLIEEIKKAQREDKDMVNLRSSINDEEAKCFSLELKKKILEEAHQSQFSIRPSGNKMYQDLRKKFWWTHMRREIACFVAECDVCQRVKPEHFKPGETLQTLPIPSWKWEDISMNFIVGFCRAYTPGTHAREEE
jgi:hypothetical protein